MWWRFYKWLVRITSSCPFSCRPSVIDRLAIPDTYCSMEDNMGHKCHQGMVCQKLELGAESRQVTGYNGFEHIGKLSRIRNQIDFGCGYSHQSHWYQHQWLWIFTAFWLGCDFSVCSWEIMFFVVRPRSHIDVASTLMEKRPNCVANRGPNMGGSPWVWFGAGGIS